jgi:glycosyltransferase involved in cell wall biosynthesis
MESSSRTTWYPSPRTDAFRVEADAAPARLRGVAASPDQARSPRVLLILRPPPPFGGGEVIAGQLERLFAGRYAVLAFRRPRHSKGRQGQLSFTNLTFGLRYIAVGCARLVVTKPRALYVDVPKDRPSFLRTSVVLLVALALRVRVVGDLAGADFPFLAGRSPVACYARAVLRRLHGIRVLGGAVAANLEARGLHNTIVVSNGIEEPPGGVPARTFPAGDARFLYVGKVAVAKGITTLAEAMASSAADEPGWRLDVVGEWESEATREHVLAEVAAVGLGDRIAFHGLLEGDAKWEAYRRAHLLLHPSRWDGQPVTILEAFALGLPVVATRVGAIPDTVRHGVDGHLMADGTAEELLAGIRGVLRDADTYAGFCAAARKAYEERFSDAAFGAAMAAVLEEAAGARASSARKRHDVGEVGSTGLPR